LILNIKAAAPPEAVTLPKSGRFSAFSFVDRIVLIDGVKLAKGVYTIPEQVSYFPVSLVAEALGQLAAWVAMSNCDFARRPVAALAGDTRIHAYPLPGDTLDLHVDIDSCDRDSIAYRGRAYVGDRLILELLDTLGSNLDIEIFDDPKALAEDFALLVGAGRAPSCFSGVPLPAVCVTERQTALRIDASLDVPDEADYFHDHFPRRPVFPATLLLDAQLQLAQSLIAEMPEFEQGLQVTRITNVKVRAFTSPGATLGIFAEVATPGEADPEPVLIKVGALAGSRTIAAAKIYFAPKARENA